MFSVFLYSWRLAAPRFFFFSSRRRHTRSLCDWSSDVCSSDLVLEDAGDVGEEARALLAVDVPVVEGERQGGDLPDRQLVLAAVRDDPRLLADRAEAQDR